MSHAARVELLAAYRPVLERLLREARQSRLEGALAGYVAMLLEPSGYILAVGLQRRYGEPNPEELLRQSLEGELTSAPVLAGIVLQDALAELLAELTPNLIELVPQLGDPGAPREPAPPLRVLVAAGRGAEILSIPDLAG